MDAIFVVGWRNAIFSWQNCEMPDKIHFLWVGLAKYAKTLLWTRRNCWHRRLHTASARPPPGASTAQPQPQALAKLLRPPLAGPTGCLGWIWRKDDCQGVPHSPQRSATAAQRTAPLPAAGQAAGRSGGELTRPHDHDLASFFLWHPQPRHHLAWCSRLHPFRSLLFSP